MSNRFRFRDSRTGSGGARYQNFTKASCPLGAAWSTYYTLPPNTFQVGKYENMDDIVGDRPVPELGIKGYKFHPMSSSSQAISAGSGTGTWEIVSKTLTCAAPDSYNIRYRRVNDGTSLARHCSGFAFHVDPNGRLLMPSFVDLKSRDRAVNLAVTACLSKVGRNRAGSNLYEALFEVDKTLNSLTDLFKIGKRLVGSKTFRSATTHAGSAYLLARYGLKPVCADISNTLIAIDAMLGLVAETSRGSEVGIGVTTFSTSTSDAASIIITGAITRTQTVTARAMSLVQYNFTRLDALGLGSKQLLTVPWELLPYSFVVDWFANVGDFIGSITPAFGVQQIGSCLAVETKTVDSWMQTGYSLVSPGSFDLVSPPSPGYCTSQYIEKIRTLGLPLPSISMKSDFKFNNMTRCLDALALLKQRIAR